MHSSLTLSKVGGLWYVERAVSGLISALRSHCDSIHSCDFNVEGPTGSGAAGWWRIDLKIRVLNEIVRATARTPAGSDAQQSLSRALADIYANARAQLDDISELHGDCCCHGGEDTPARAEACA